MNLIYMQLLLSSFGIITNTNFRLNERLDAAETGSRYNDASHFSREYKRHFGAPPMRDVEQLRRLVAE